MHTIEIGILEEGDQVSLNGLLKSTDGRRQEATIGLEVLSDLTDQSVEGELAGQKLGGLLVTTNLTKSDGTRHGLWRKIRGPGCINKLVKPSDHLEQCFAQQNQAMMQGGGTGSATNGTWLISVMLLDTTCITNTLDLDRQKTKKAKKKKVKSKSKTGKR